MSRETINLTPQLYDYVLDHSLRKPDVLRRLREETATLEAANMQIAADQGQFMALLAKLMGARRVIEVGTFTGYSALALALALPPEGRVTCCDLSEAWTAVARRYWREAGVGDRIDLYLQPALATLEKLREDGGAGTYDFAFIDADKENYDAYYEHCLALIRPGGLITVDNVLWGGSVIDEAKRDADTEAIRRFNRRRADDDRVDIAMVPVGDGLTLLRKR